MPASPAPKPAPPSAADAKGPFPATAPGPPIPGLKPPTPPPPAMPPARQPSAALPGAKAPSGATPGPDGEEPAAAPGNRRQANLPLQRAIEGIGITLFLALTIVPLARIGLLPIPPSGQVTLLVVVSLLLIAPVALYQKAGYHLHGARVSDFSAARRREDRVLNTLSIATAILFAVLFIAEIAAFLVFLGVIQATEGYVVVVADFFLMFAAFTLLFLDLLLIARTSFDSRFTGKGWYRELSYTLLGLSALVSILALLKNVGVLNVGFFAAITPRQSPYLLTLGVLLQFLAYRMILRYPSIAFVFRHELELARRANKEVRVNLERQALRTYLVGLVFVLVSFVLIGGVATGRVTTGDSGTTGVIVVAYVVLAVILLLVIAGRWLQHRFIADRARRQERGEVIARRRLTPDQMVNLFVYGFSGTFGLLFAVLGTLTFLGRTQIPIDYGTDLFIAAFLVGIGPLGFKRVLDTRRIRAMDDKFPDFLRDLAEGMRAGMTLPRALFSSAQGTYGALTKEIVRMNHQVEWGVSFTDALLRFSDRVKTPLIQRTVSLINEAARAGGSVVDILTAASQDAREIKMILDERRRQMGIYSVIIYVAYLVFLVVVYVLAVQFLPSFQSAVQGASGAQVGGLSFAEFDMALYVRIFFHAALIQGIGGGLVAGVMTEGHALGGLRHSFIMTIISWVFFRILL